MSNLDESSINVNMSYLTCTACRACDAILFCHQCRSLLCQQCVENSHEDHPTLNLEVITDVVCVRDPSHPAIFFCNTCQSYYCYSCYENEHRRDENNNHQLNKARLVQNDDSDTEPKYHSLESTMSSTDEVNVNNASAFEEITLDYVPQRRPSFDQSLPQSNQYATLSSPSLPSLFVSHRATSLIPSTTTEDHEPILLIDGSECLTVDDATKFSEKLQSSSPDPSVKCVSIIGNTGDGKSFTLNKLFFDGHEKFRTSATSDSCTMGVWAALDDSAKTLILDTEGRLGLSQNDNVRNRLLLKILCISDIIIFRTRAPKLPNDMFQFLSDASKAFLKYFRCELESVMKTCQTDGPMSMMGPTLIVFHETQHTDVLKDTLEGHKTAVEQLKERFEKMNLTYEAYSLIEYVGVKTPAGKATDFDTLEAVINDNLSNNKIRSPRRLSVIFRALKALNEKFNHKIPSEMSSSLPDEFFTCCVRCTACGAKCTVVANHEKQDLPHHTDEHCIFNSELNNEIYKCRQCLNEGKDTIVYGKLTNKTDDLVQGLLKYVWSGFVLECPYHGEIYRSRKHWFGNEAPKDVAHAESIHVWSSNRNDRLGSDVTPRKVFDLIQSAGSYISGPTKRLSELVADQVAPSYWVPNKDITHCHSCSLEFNVQHSKHHCRECGQIFCDTCTTHRAIVPRLTTNTAERVCDECYQKLKAHLLSPIYHSNHHAQDIEDSFNIDDEASSNEMTNSQSHSIPKSRQVFEVVTNSVGSFVSKYPLHLIKEGTRPYYWQADEECHVCWVCEQPFNTTTRRLHHCRQCGRGVCDPCSPTRRPVLERDWNTPERVCQKCVNQQ